MFIHKNQKIQWRLWGKLSNSFDLPYFLLGASCACQTYGEKPLAAVMRGIVAVEVLSVVIYICIFLIAAALCLFSDMLLECLYCESSGAKNIFLFFFLII